VAHLIEDNHRETAKIFERVGLVCFLVAVIAELGAYKYGERNDELSQGVINSLSEKAKTAFNNASSALIKSGESQTKADAADLAALKAMNEAKSVTPRGALLKEAANELIKTALRFPEQKVILLVCGVVPQGVLDPIDFNSRERLNVWETLLHILSDKGGWTAFGKQSWSDCPLSTVGLQVYVDNGAPEQTLKAATALSKTLDSVLPPQPVPTLVKGDWSHDKGMVSPTGWVTEYHDCVAILIGTMPLPVADTTKRQESGNPRTKR
jgi:hypothetical protein